MRPLSIFTALFLCFAISANAQFGAPETESSLVVGVTSVAPGETFTVAVELTHAPEWHSYYKNPGGVGMPLSLTWKLPEGFGGGDVIFPTPHKASVPGAEGDVTFYGYEGRNVFLADVTVPENAEIGSEIDFEVGAMWLVCNDRGCNQERVTFNDSITISEKTVPNPDGVVLIEEAREHLPKAGKDIPLSISETDAGIIVTAGLPAEVENPKTAYFYSSDRQIDAQQKQSVSFKDGKAVFSLKRNLGDEANFIEAGPKLASLDGIVVIKAGGSEFAFQVSGAFGGVEETAVSGEPQTGEEVVESEAKGFSSQWTEEEIAEGAALYSTDDRPKFELLDGSEEKKLTLLPALGLVFVGGLLLNLMPCVLPVLGLKIMSFVQQAGEDESKVKKHGMVFGLGVLVSMWILSGLIIAAGETWGAQLTSPIFVAGIIILLFLMGLNLAGVFEFGTAMTSVGGELQSKKGYSGSFFSGVLTTLIATPCSGPFLGAVMGFALAEKAPIALLVFTMFALGIASPYIVLSFFPKLINKLPRPGAWMEHFKKGMSFALFATVAFFLRSFANQTGYDGLSWLLFALVVIAFAAWIYGTWSTPMQSKKIRMGIGYGLTILVALLGIKMTSIAVKKEAPILAGGDDWKQWFPGAMELSRSKKRIAWIDYTAEW